MTEPSGGRVRAGDADRDRVVERLRAHHEAGRLDAEEFTSRMEQALAATYLDELPPLLADLPPEPTEREQGERQPGSARRDCAARALFRRFPVPVLAIVAAFVLLSTVGALAHGHPPFGLLWLAVLLFSVHRWHHRRRAASPMDDRAPGAR